MNKVSWTVVVIFSVVMVFAFVVGLGLFGGWRYGGWGMMGPGMMGGWGFSPFGWLGMFGMIFMWLIPVGLVVLAVLGMVGLFRSIGSGRGGGPVSPPRSCPNCGRAAQADWLSCPYCGQNLT